MAVYPRTGRSPEALVKILVTVIEKSPYGGATLDDIREAYLEAKEVSKPPADKTLYRNIRRINELFNPHAYDEGFQNESTNSRNALSRMIYSSREKSGKMRYLYGGKSLTSNIESEQILTLLLSLYSQQKGLLKDHFEKVIGLLLVEVMNKKDGSPSFFMEIEDHIHVSGQGSREPKKLLRRISEIIRAIENCKLVKIDYLRTYDGVTRTRMVEPYGLVCRHGSWYLVGLCCNQQKRRIYKLDHVRRLKVEENSTFKRPAGLSMTGIFKDAWGIWNIDDEQKAVVETVRLRVKKGLAERFKAVSFHDSQRINTLPNGEAEVIYKVSGAGEMIPWLSSWGPSLVVLEPQWLKKQLLQYLQDTMNSYR